MARSHYQQPSFHRLSLISPDQKLRKYQIRHKPQPGDNSIHIHRRQFDGVVDAPFPGSERQGGKRQCVATDHVIAVSDAIAVPSFDDRHPSTEYPAGRERYKRNPRRDPAICVKAHYQPSWARYEQNIRRVDVADDAMRLWISLAKRFRKLRKTREQHPQTRVHVNKKCDPPVVDVDVLLFDLQEADVGVVWDVSGRDPGHLERQECKHQKRQ